MSEDSLRIPISKITDDMVLSKDIISRDGIVLVPKNTSLSNINARRLRELGIDYVAIKPAVPKKLIKVRKAPKIVEKVEFKSFEGEYQQSADEYKSLVQNISAGKKVDISELYSLTHDVLQSLEIKTDVFTYVNYISQADEYIFNHCINVSILCNIFANWLKLNPKAIMELTVAGLLHDLGMTKVPRELVNKAGPLTAKEVELVKTHPTAGYKMLLNQQLPDSVKAAVLLHHERMDGSGYPLKVNASKISVYAKILSICDIYDAMTSDRPYRKKFSPFAVMRTLETGMYAELDTRYLLTFLQNIAYNYLGSWVRLSDTRPAEIMFIHRLNVSRPIVRTMEDEIIDLAAHADLKIASLL